MLNTNTFWRLAIDVSNHLNTGESPYDLWGYSGKALTREAKILYHNAIYLKYLQEKRDDDAENALQTLIKLLEEQPDLLKEEPGMYVSSINNLVSYLIFKKNHKDALELINKAKTIYNGFNITSENRVLLKQILRTYNVELEIYRSTKAYSAQSNFIKKTETFVMENMNKMPKEYLISFWFQLASIYFMKKDLTRSLHYVNQLLNSKFGIIRPDLQLHARILNLMIHLEQQNLFVHRYFVDSTRRFMKKVKQAQSYEEILLKFFAKIGNTPLMEYRTAISSLKDQLFPSPGESLVPADAIGYIDYKEWIEGKLKK